MPEGLGMRRRYIKRRYPDAKLKKIIAAKLFELRKKSKKSTNGFAKDIGLTWTQLKNVLQGKKILELATIINISEITGCGILWLIGMAEDGKWEDGYVHRRGTYEPEQTGELSDG